MSQTVRSHITDFERGELGVHAPWEYPSTRCGRFGSCTGRIVSSWRFQNKSLGQSAWGYTPEKPPWSERGHSHPQFSPDSVRGIHDFLGGILVLEGRPVPGGSLEPWRIAAAGSFPFVWLRGTFLATNIGLAHPEGPSPPEI